MQPCSDPVNPLLTQSTLFSPSQPCSHPVNPVLTQLTLFSPSQPCSHPVNPVVPTTSFRISCRRQEIWADYTFASTLGGRGKPLAVRDWTQMCFLHPYLGGHLTDTDGRMTDGHLRKQLNFLCMLHIPLTDTLHRLHESSVIEPQLSHQTFVLGATKRNVNTNQKTGTCR